MYKYEPWLPSNSKIFRQDMCTLWKREQYMAYHPSGTSDFNFSGHMSELYPPSYPIGLWNEWPFNMGMNNMGSTAIPCFESGIKSSSKNDKGIIARISEEDVQGQVTTKPIHSTNLKQHGQFRPRYTTTPIHPSYSKKQSQFTPRQVPPLVHPLYLSQQSQLCTMLIPPPVQPSKYKEYDQLSPKPIPAPVQHSSYKPHKNSFINSNNNTSRNQVCRFCLQNGEGEEFYRDHRLKDSNGKVTCPILRRYVCDICNATGDFAHTRAYCPFYKEKNKKPLAVILKQTCHDSSGRIRK